MAAVLVSYFAVLGVLAALGLYRLRLVAAACAHGAAPAPGLEDRDWPSVLVQLPLFNERYVAERLLRAVARLDYPKEALRIQVLDDSTDETRWLVRRVVAELAQSGVPISVVSRVDRRGYKAGALGHGLAAAPDAELVAIFDADFVPASDFLRRTVPHLVADPSLGLVQARWGHLNRDTSWLTRAQAVFLDGHFGVEHPGRARCGMFFNFNGTAGVWRRRAIDDAGGWSSDTITEDLDLSYRAQLAGWRFAFVSDVEVPAELPEAPSAFRSQQARWVRGSIETARKHLPRIVRQPGLRLSQRVDAFVHLTNNFAYLFMAALAVLLPVAVVIRDRAGWRVYGGQPLLSGLDLLTLGLGTAAMLVFYAVGLARTGGLGVRRVPDVLFALCLGAGMSLANAKEVLRGLRSRESEFVRTPKFGGARREAAQTYAAVSVLRRVAPEASFSVYYLAALAYAVRFELWGAVPFLALYLIGFGALCSGAAREAWRRRAAAVMVPRTSP